MDTSNTPDFFSDFFAGLRVYLVWTPENALLLSLMTCVLEATCRYKAIREVSWLRLWRRFHGTR